MDYATEVQTKLELVRDLMAAHNLDTLWLRRVEDVSWITGGIDVAVNTAAAIGVATVVITPDTCEMWTNTIEAPRLQAEDQVRERGFELRVTPWHEAEPSPQSAALGVDFPLPGAHDLSGELALLRATLLPVEQERFRDLGRRCADAMQAAIGRVQPGMTEEQIGAALADETRACGANPVVVLIGTDERVHKVRHPIPTGKTLDRYAMLVLCGRRDGLVCSVTRLVHFGPISADVQRRMNATADVDAAMLAASQPGTTLEQVFRAAQDAYARAGFADEWKLHHQGGLAGYTAREMLGVPGATAELKPGMVCAWNPSISGAKCEDSILVTARGQAPEILTAIEGWPVRTVEISGLTLARPVILQV